MDNTQYMEFGLDFSDKCVFFFNRAYNPTNARPKVRYDNTAIIFKGILLSIGILLFMLQLSANFIDKEYTIAIP